MSRRPAMSLRKNAICQQGSWATLSLKCTITCKKNSWFIEEIKMTYAANWPDLKTIESNCTVKKRGEANGRQWSSIRDI